MKKPDGKNALSDLNELFSCYLPVSVEDAHVSKSAQADRFHPPTADANGLFDLATKARVLLCSVVLLVPLPLRSAGAAL